MRNDDTGATFAVLALLSLGSGCAALIYEVVWFEQLRQIIGASPLSLAVVLASYMSGLAIGSHGFSRLVAARPHPLRIYAAMELGIAASAAILLVALPLLRQVYVSHIGYGPASTFLRAFVAFACLLPPTIFMGATLPALARWTGSSERGVSRLGILYSANTIGAAGGALLAGAYLLRFFDLAIASGVGILLNVAVASVTLLVGRDRECVVDGADSQNADRAARTGSWLIYFAIAFSGMTALGAQVIWTRLLSMLFGATVYTFAIILTVFLVGLGIGSAAGSYLARSRVSPSIALAGCQFSLILAIAAAAWSINQVLPYWSVQVPEEEFGRMKFLGDVLRGLVAMFPATVAWGASFPLALSAARHSADGPGGLVGRIYAANTLGSIVGALAIGLVIVPLWGTEAAQALLIGAAGAGCAAVLLWRGSGMRSLRMRATWAVAIAPVVVLAILLVPSTDPRLIGFGHDSFQWRRDNIFLDVMEGRTASVAVSESEQSGHRFFHVDGKVVASSTPEDIRLQRMLGHLPALLHPEPRSVLVVGLGAGVTAGSFLHYPSVERVVICEIEPRAVDAARTYFAEHNDNVLEDPRVEIIYDDARHYVATTDQRFDIITSDPLHPWVKGAAALYSKEYFAQVQSRLNAGGIVTQWVPLYQTSVSAVKSQLATFAGSFSNTTIWHNDLRGKAYDTVLLGKNGELAIGVTALEKRFGKLPAVRASLNLIGIDSHWALLNFYLTRVTDLEPWLVDAEINRDRNLRLQYLAGLAIDSFDSDRILREIRGYKGDARGLFIATQADEPKLRRILARDRADLTRDR